jgi:predicted RecA/RadA family phage recombinase
MKTYIQPGNTITLPAPYDVVSGNGLLVGAIFGIATYDAAAGAEVETQLTGVVEIAKAGTQAWAVGDRVYWDDTNRQATATATDNTLIGVAVLPVGNGVGETIGRVRLNASF